MSTATEPVVNTGEPVPTVIKAINKVSETAVILGVSPSTVKRLIFTGQLRAVKIGRLTCVTATEVKRFLTSLDETGGVRTGREAG